MAALTHEEWKARAARERLEIARQIAQKRRLERMKLDRCLEVLDLNGVRLNASLRPNLTGLTAEILFEVNGEIHGPFELPADGIKMIEDHEVPRGDA